MDKEEKIILPTVGRVREEKIILPAVGRVRVKGVQAGRQTNTEIDRYADTPTARRFTARCVSLKTLFAQGSGDGIRDKG